MPGTQKTYFIRCPDTGRVKIGKAKDPRKRLKELSTGAPSRLALLGAVDRDIESSLHKKHAIDRCVGEWFTPTPAVRDTVFELIGIDIEERPHPLAFDGSAVSAAVAVLCQSLGTKGFWISEGEEKEGADVDVTVSFEGFYAVLDENAGHARYLADEPVRKLQRMVDEIKAEEPEANVTIDDLLRDDAEACEVAAGIDCAFIDLMDVGVCGLAWDGERISAIAVTCKPVELIRLANLGIELRGCFEQAGMSFEVMAVHARTAEITCLAIDRQPYTGRGDPSRFVVLDIDAIAAEAAEAGIQ